MNVSFLNQDRRTIDPCSVISCQDANQSCTNTSPDFGTVVRNEIRIVNSAEGGWEANKVLDEQVITIVCDC